MDLILEDVERALDAKLFYVALSVALSLPGVCAALEQVDGSTSGQDKRLYMDWYDRYLAAGYPYLTALDCYSLRCGVIHQGRFGHGKMQYARVVFTIGDTLHKNILNDALNLDISLFCRDVVAAVRQWEIDKSLNLTVRRNLPLLVKYRPEGMAPYVKGAPVIS
ncbi:hypothetical protein [Gymnodinialimonas sp.]